MEEIQTGAESIKEGIHRPVHEYSDDFWVVAIRKNFSASQNTSQSISDEKNSIQLHA